MLKVIEVRKTYKYRLYRNNKVDGLLHQQINVAGIIWNHALALQKRHYKLTGKYIPLSVMQKHIAKLRMRCSKYAYWKVLGSQAVQEILERLDEAYVRFFKIGGFDFGLADFLTTDEGATIESPQYYQRDLPRLRAIQSRVSHKVKGSNNHKAGTWHINRRHIRIADKRLDFHVQLAHALCDQYDVMVFEDLNLDGIKHLWGRKISDLGFAQFVKVLDWVAYKRGKRIIKISRWERTTGKCSRCGHRQKLELSDRVFKCEGCGNTLGHDHNAANNILEAGHRLILSQSTEVLANSEAVGANGRSPYR